MLQKATHIIITLTLLISTMGFTVSKHYCGTRLVDININKEAQSCCGDEGTSKCCHNETKHFQVENDFNMTVSAEISIPFVYITPVLFLLSDQLTCETETPVDIEASPPPLPLNTRLSYLQSYLN